MVRRGRGSGDCGVIALQSASSAAFFLRLIRRPRDSHPVHHRGSDRLCKVRALIHIPTRSMGPSELSCSCPSPDIPKQLHAAPPGAPFSRRSDPTVHPIDKLPCLVTPVHLVQSLRLGNSVILPPIGDQLTTQFHAAGRASMPHLLLANRKRPGLRRP